MQQVNLGRTLLGGLLAGAVINAFEFVLNFFVLEKQLAVGKGLIASEEVELTVSLLSGKEIAAINVWGFLVGLAAIWLYAVLRDRLGQGARTAIYAGTFVWLLVCLLVRLRPDVTEILAGPARVTSLAVLLVAIVLGTLLGAWQYRGPGEQQAPVEPEAH